MKTSRKGAVVRDLARGTTDFADRIERGFAALGARDVRIERVFDDGLQADVAFERDIEDAAPDVNRQLAPFAIALVPDSDAGSQ